MALTHFHNPLDEFATYSVHYVMLACRTTEDARVFISDSDTPSGAAINAATLSAIESVKYLGDSIPYGDNKETAYLVMDTRRFSQFTVERFKYDALINGLQATGSQGNLVTTVEMTIIDSAGISFINFIMWLMDTKMQCNFDGMIYMMRVIFVGHTPEGKTKTVTAITIPMHLFKLELNLDYAKGAYTCEFMPNMNFDAQRHSRWLNINSASSYFSGNGNTTLGGMVDSFETALNERSQAYYLNASTLIQNARGKDSKNKHGKFGRQVRYQISLPKEWRIMEFKGNGTAASTEIIFKKQLDDKENPNAAEKPAADEKPAAAAEKPAAANDKAGKPTDSTMSVQSGILITDVLNLMFKQVPKIAELGNGRQTPGSDSKGSISFYNYLLGTSSNNETVIVHVDVIPFEVPNAIIEAQKTLNSVARDDANFYNELEDANGKKTGIRIPKEFIEYDYIFTGRNKDILNFDLKLQDLQWLLASNLEMGAGAMQSKLEEGQTSDGKAINPSAELVSARAYDALLLPKNSSEELETFSAYSRMVLNGPEGDQIRSGQQDYLRNLSNFYAASPITCAITIRGNPYIMSKFANTKILPHISTATAIGAGSTSAISTSAQEKYREDLTSRIIKDNQSQTGIPLIAEENGVFVVKSITDRHYASTPVFVKINIKGPNVDDKTGDMKTGDFAREILQNNFYVVMKVTNIIEGSNFTQDLELYSHNVFGRGKVSGPPDKTIKAKT